MSVFWYACCLNPLNPPLGIRNLFVKWTECLAASELLILFLCSLWASLPFQVAETVERCWRTCEVPCDGLSLWKCYSWNADNTQCSHFCPWSYMGVLISWEPLGPLWIAPLSKVHLTVNIQTSHTRWRCCFFHDKAVAIAIWVPCWHLLSACARALHLQHCRRGALLPLLCSCSGLTSWTAGYTYLMEICDQKPWVLLVCALQQQKLQALGGANLQNADQ